jgi:hypothetical protein
MDLQRYGPGRKQTKPGAALTGHQYRKKNQVERFKNRIKEYAQRIRTVQQRSTDIAFCEDYEPTHNRISSKTVQKSSGCR